MKAFAMPTGEKIVPTVEDIIICSQYVRNLKKTVRAENDADKIYRLNREIGRMTYLITKHSASMSLQLLKTKTDGNN